MYVVVSGFYVLGSTWQQCAQYGANIFTIDHQHQLHYVVQNIMLHLTTVFTTIGIMLQVRFIVKSIMIS